MNTKNSQAVEGIILATFAFEENAHILALLTKEYGRIKCVFKNSKKNEQRAVSALLGVESLVIPSDKELWKCRDMQVVTSYPKLRLKLSTLQFAAEVTDLLDKLLPLHLPVPEIYFLYTEYLQELQHFQYPETAAALFLAKLAYIEGLIDIPSDIETRRYDELYDKEPQSGYYQRLLYQIRN